MYVTGVCLVRAGADHTGSQCGAGRARKTNHGTEGGHTVSAGLDTEFTNEGDQSVNQSINQSCLDQEPGHHSSASFPKGQCSACRSHVGVRG